MQVLLKILLSLLVILAATAVARKFPAIAGLIAVMPLTGALVLVWVYLENDGAPTVMQAFTKGALWGILPSIIFFLVALLCLKKEVALPGVLGWSFGGWVLAAIIHRWVIK